MYKIIRFCSFSKIIPRLLLISFVIMATGCSYFKVTRTAAPPVDEIRRLRSEDKFFILHLEDKVWHINDISIVDNNFTGSISMLSGHQSYLKATPDEPVRYKRSVTYNGSEALHEVHIYITSLTYIEPGKVTFPAEAVSKIDIYDKAIGATVSSWVLSGFGLAATAFAATGIIALATSCPFAYPYNGENYIFSGEIFSGAVQPGLERDDYLFVPQISPSEGKYRIILTNEIHEIQSVNLAELWTIDHPSDMSALIDKYGTPYLIHNPEAPISACSKDKSDILPLLIKKDSLSYLGNKSGIGKDGVEEITLEFLKPPGVLTSQLVIRAKNSLWLDGLIQKIHKLFGERYTAYSLKQEKKSGDELRKWSLDQNIPLSVYIERDKEWEFVDYYNLAGPLALKDDILSINLRETDSDTIRIKLETGFLFWELDYSVMNFSVNKPKEIVISEVESASDKHDTDVRDLMLGTDTSYVVLDDPGDEVCLVFDHAPQTDVSRSVFLHSRGYYKIIREQSGEPDKKTLRTFRRPGRVPEFSKEMFDAVLNN